MAGQVIAWSLIHGGPAGNFFSSSLYNAIVFTGKCRLAYIEDICNSELREKVNRVCPFVELFYLYEYKIHEKIVHMSFYNLYNIFLTVKVSNADTVDDLKKALEDSTVQEILEAQGALSTVLCISDRDRMCKLLVQHIVIDSVEYLVNEVKEGLKTLGVLEAIQQHPEKFREVFCKENSPKLDAHMVDLLFSPNFNEEGSNQRPLQEEAVVYWRDYLQDCMSM